MKKIVIQTSRLWGDVTIDRIVGKRICKIRAMQDQSVVAAKLGISQSAYSRMERGETKITVNDLYALSRCFECAMYDFLIEVDNFCTTDGHLEKNTSTAPAKVEPK